MAALLLSYQYPHPRLHSSDDSLALEIHNQNWLRFQQHNLNVVMFGGGGLFSGLIGRRRQEAEDRNGNRDDLEPQFPTTTPPTGYGSIDNNEGIGGGDINEEEVAIGGALLPGAEPPDRPTPTEEAQPPVIPPIVNPEGVESEEEAVQSLTQRLRCLFTVLTVSAPFAFGLGFSLAGHACLSKWGSSFATHIH